MMHETNKAALIGIRAYAALWIYFGHIFLYPIYNAGFGSPAHLGPLDIFIGFHFLAVDFFFVLSGCLLTLKYREYFEAPRKSREIDGFFALRLARVWPLHLFFTLVMGAWVWAGYAAPISSGLEETLYEYWEITGVLNFFLMNGWGILPVASWNEPAWTLSIFFLLYLLFPNLIAAMRFIPERTSYILTGLFATLLLYGFLRELLALSSHSDGVGAILRGFFFFLTGLWVARLYQLGAFEKLSWHRIGITLLFVGPVLMYLWAYYAKFPLTLFHLTYPLVMLVLLYARGPLLCAMAHPTIQWLGERAFAIYLLHYPYLLILKALAGETLGAFAAKGTLSLILSYVGVTLLMLALCELCYRFIEMPCYRFAKKRFKPLS